MEDSSHREHRQERTLRAIQVAATSGFVEHNLRLQESCLALCNWCREYVPLQFMRICSEGPSKFLAVFGADLLCLEADDHSRVMLPKRVLKVDWTFSDYAGRLLVEHSFFEMRTEDEIAEHRGVTACNFKMSNMCWPAAIREVYFDEFNRPIDDVVWPDSLKRLAFCNSQHDDKFARCGTFGIFNQSLDGATFPAGLRELYLGPEFDRCIENVNWPEGLELLSMPGFDYPIGNVRWPPRLKTLNFLVSSEIKHRQSPGGWGRAWHPCDPNVGFNGPLDSLPVSLETLWLSDNFNQPLRGVTWPSELALLGLGTRISMESMHGIEWPPNLRKLVLSDFFEDVVFDPHPSCEVCEFRLNHGDWIPLD